MNNDLALTHAYFAHGVIRRYDSNVWASGQLELVDKLLPYSKKLNKIANFVCDKVVPFSGVFVYEIAEEKAAVLFHKMLAGNEGVLPGMEEWAVSVTKMILEWTGE